ncbi:MAG: PKD domain-containing protein [Bacteroidales bacterium]
MKKVFMTKIYIYNLNIKLFSKLIYSISFLIIFLNNLYAQPCNIDTLNSNFAFNQFCNSKTINFANNPIINSGSIISYHWDFGDGSVSLLQNPNHTFLSYGNYSVLLTLTHSSGCTSIKMDTVRIVSAPEAHFSITNDSLCPNQAVNFHNLSVGAGLKYEWFFRDGVNYNFVSDTLINPLHNFNTAIGNTFQSYNVMLKVTDVNNCSDSSTHQVVIKQRPSVDYLEIGNFRRCENVIAAIIDTAMIFNYSNVSQISSYQIDWGDGSGFIPIATNFTNTSNIQHVYNAINNYPITIIAIGLNGCISTFKDTFEIITIPLPEFSSLSFSSGCIPFEVYTINNSSSITANTHTFINWGDNSIDTLNAGTLPGDTLRHYYTQTTCVNGIQQPYNIILTTENECGAPFKSYGPINAFAPPEANVDIIEDTVCVGNPAIFKNYSKPNFCAANPRTLYSWDFGDSVNTSVMATLLNPTPDISHVYNYPGTFTIILKAENNSLPSTGHPGCGSTTDTIRIHVFETTADFSFDTVCFGSPTHFNDLSFAPGGSIISRTWDFGDGIISTQQNPQHIYSSPGHYIVSLSATGSLGCTDIKLHTIIVDSLPSANFLFSKTCFGDTTFFQNFSFPNSDSISFQQWSFGDNSIVSLLKEPFHIYSLPGNYNTTISVFNNKACKKDTTINVIVHANPIASFYTDTVCSGYQRIFTNNSIAAAYSINSYFWNMGDGIGSCINIDTTYYYSGTGTYPVKLFIGDSFGCKDDTTINIYLGPVPIAEFTFDTVCFGTPTHFTNTTNSQNIPITSKWNFEDLSSSSLSNPNHTFNSLSTFNVELIVTNINGCIDTISHIISLDTLPHPLFYTTSVCLNDTSSFIDLSTATASTIFSRSWNFSDGSFSSLQNPYHIFQNSGIYNVRLTITDENGCENDTSKLVDVWSLPSPSFVVTTPCTGQISTFYPNTNSPIINNWSWNFGINNDSSNIQNPSYTYLQSGNYNIILTVKDINGCKGDSLQSIFISPLPVANFIFDTVCFGDFTHFTDISMDSNSLINTWNWNFGDLNSSANVNPIHKYGNPGIYNVDLQIINSFGCIDSSSHNIIVDSSSIAIFTSNTVTIGSTTIFNSINSSNLPLINSWNWNFGDGFTSVLNNPTHLYAMTDTFQVILTVMNIHGCKDTSIQDVIVYPLLNVDFSVNQVCLGNISNFFDNSISPGGAIVSWLWKFGDGYTSNLQNPNHQYITFGNYTVWLIVIDINGNKDSISHVAKVNPNPTALFYSDTVCSGETSHFVNGSFSNASVINSWNWDFGDGSNTSSLQNPLYKYTSVLSSTDYSVRLIVTDSLGCKDTVINNIRIYPPVYAEFITDTVCVNSPIHLTDISNSEAGIITNWNWNFGNGVGVSSLQNPLYTYTNIINDTTFQISLEVTDYIGCKDTIYHHLIVHPQPVVFFSSDTTCFGLNTHFSDLSYSNGGPLSIWNWNFGGIATSNLQNPSYMFLNAGIFNTTLTINDINGCSNSIVIPIVIDSIPEVNFVSHGNCASGLIHFTDNSIQHGSNNTLWNWNFGDSYSSTMQNPIHYYSTTDTFNVSLTITNSNGCIASETKIVYVNPSMSYDFNFDTVCVGLLTNFYDNFLIQNTQITTWLWDFGDGFLSTIHNTQHLFSSSGTYNVSLTVVDTNGCIETIHHNTIVNAKPIPDFTSTNKCLGDSTKFINTSYSAIAVISYYWDFGDGITSSLKNPIHLYNSSGTFSVKLIIFNSNGCCDSISKNISVSSKPSADFSVGSICSGFPVIISDSSLNVVSSINTWLWNFGDGDSLFIPSPSFYLPTISHAYNYPGSYIIKLTVGNSVCIDTISKTIEVYSIPVAGFTVPNNCLGDTSKFTDFSVASIYPINSWVWNFGDGLFSNLQNPRHKYNYSGIYQVTLTITDAHGCSNSIQKTIRIFSLPIAEFTSNIAPFPSSTQFINSSIANSAAIINWNWDFGDGIGFNNLQNPIYNYLNIDTFYTQLIVTDTNGCKDTISHSVIVCSPFIQANFSFNNACENSYTFFSDSSFISNGNGIQTWSWDFGDASTSILKNPKHQYVNPGIYNVQLIITGIFGVTDTIFKTVTVYPKPHADFDNSGVCLGVNKTFTNLSTIQLGNIINWNWDFGNGAYSNTLNHITVYNNFGYYNVKLIVNSDMGCSDSIIKLINIAALPVVSFTSDITEACNSANVIFTSTAMVDSGFITTWNWNFDDGVSSLMNNNQVGHTFQSTGSYNISLKAISNKGCENSLIIPNMIVIHPNPKAIFSITPSITSVLNSKIFFINNSTEAANWNWSFGDGDSSKVHSPIHTYIQEGTYFPKLKVKSDYGCSDEIIMKVVILEEATFYIPNAFTPNNDGYNDVFIPLSIDFSKGKFEMMIFNRWGEMVFHTEDYNNGWNGSRNGEICPDGVYIWKINYTDALGRSQKETGHLTLIR